MRNSKKLVPYMKSVAPKNGKGKKRSRQAVVELTEFMICIYHDNLRLTAENARLSEQLSAANRFYGEFIELEPVEEEDKQFG